MIGISDRRVRLVTVAIGVVGLIALAASPAAAQDISVNFGQGGPNSGLTERVVQMIAMLTVLSLAPSILVMMTSFTRIVVVLSLLRTALGTATAPPNAVIVSLALFLTAFVMGPALQVAYDTGIRPLVANEITAIHLAHELNIAVIAEGVETEAQAQFLLAAGCENAQGYYYSRPVNAEAAAILLRKGRIEAVKERRKTLKSVTAA